MHFSAFLNVLLERIEPFNVIHVFLYALVVLLESIDLILADYVGMFLA